MRRAALLALAALPLALAACPLPQPLAEVARTDGGVSTPIILPETAVPTETTVFVRTNCNPPQFTLTATVSDLDTDEFVEARWFLDWNPNTPTLLADTAVPASGDPNDPLRPIPPLVFQPQATAPQHVVEVVVSNNFLATSDGTQPFQRAAPPPFQTHSYLWVFQFVGPTDSRGRCQ